MTHTKPLFFNTRVLTVNNLYIYNIGSFMHAFINGKQPIPFNNMFTFNSYIHNHGTRQASRLHTPVGKTSFSYKTIKFRGVSIYNNIIFLNIDTKCSTAAFKAQLKDLLLSGHNFVFSWFSSLSCFSRFFVLYYILFSDVIYMFVWEWLFMFFMFMFVM